ncbi:MAG TPA: SRPBCC family protein [Nodosilinea sp.]|nr:SRPBCC family protein [Nodosilinea sp.]
MDINSKAPAIARHDIAIAAPSDTVWALLTDIDQWPTWNPNISAATLEGELKPGTCFRWRSGGTAIVSTLQTVEPRRRLVWTGKVMGIRAIHTWSLEPQAHGVVVSTAESFEGWMAQLMKPMLQPMLDTTLKTWLEHLKHQAETASSRAA